MLLSQEATQGSECPAIPLPAVANNNAAAAVAAPLETLKDLSCVRTDQQPSQAEICAPSDDEEVANIAAGKSTGTEAEVMTAPKYCEDSPVNSAPGVSSNSLPNTSSSSPRIEEL